MSRPTPRLTRFMAVVKTLEELDARMIANCQEDFQREEEFSKGTFITLIYLRLVYLRHWEGRDIGWPNHLASLEKLFTRYNRLQKAVRWTIGNDLPEDDLLESLTRFLTLEFKKYDSAPGGFKPCWWHSTQEYLHTLVRDHLNSVRQPSLDDLQAAAVDRDYFNNWTGQSKPKEQ